MNFSNKTLIRLLTILSLFIVPHVGLYAQSRVFSSKKSLISFYSSAPLENIEAKTTKAAGALSLSNGDVVFKLKVNTFEFSKKLMQEHFNENYLESDKYPLAEFKGKIIDFEKIKANGTYTVNISGNLLIHGVSKQYNTKATLVLNNKELKALSNFDVRLADHKIKIPSIVGKNIAEVVQVKVSIDFLQAETKK